MTDRIRSAEWIALRGIADRVRMAHASGDAPKAHQAQDQLHVLALRAIAAGTSEDPKELAQLALSTERLGFARWYE